MCIVAKRRYSEAISCYEKAVSVAPRKFSIDSAIGFTYFLMNQLDKAVHFYHKVAYTFRSL